MARKKPMQYVAREDRPEFLALVAELASVPPEQFAGIAMQCVEKYHDAVLAGHVEVLDQMEDAYKALVFKLNGDTMFGCGANDDSPANVLARSVAAKPGQVPSWGQCGEFLLEVEGMRIRVEFNANMLGNHHACDLHAVDLERPFVSTTGFRSAGVAAASCLGETVDQAARRMVLDLMENAGKPKPITVDFYSQRAADYRPQWLVDALAGVRPNGQLAMFGDAPKDPGAKVPLSNKERQKAFRERQRKLKEEQGMQSMLLDESERQLIDQLREQKRGIDHSQDPRPFLLTQRDRHYLTSALDYHEFATYRMFKQDYPMQNLRDLYVRLSVHQSYAQATDFPPIEKRQAWVHEQTKQALYKDYQNKIAALENENSLLEGERNKALGAIRLWEERLRKAGLSTDYRPQGGE